MSNHHKDDDYTITVNLDIPASFVHPAEIRLIAAHFGDLLRDVIREMETEE